MRDADVIRRREHELYARLPAFERLVSRTRAFLSEHLDEHAFVAFSGGKDSAAMAHLCHAVSPGIPILMVDISTDLTDADREMWRSYVDEHGWALRTFAWDKWADVSDAATDIAHQQAAHRHMFAGMHQYCAQHGLDTVVMGIRREESLGRRYRVRSGVHEYHQGPYRRALYPIGGWSQRDVWAYIESANLPCLEIYRRQGESARSGLIGRSGGPERQSMLRMLFPEHTAELRRRVSDPF